MPLSWAHTPEFTVCLCHAQTQAETKAEQHSLGPFQQLPCERKANTNSILCRLFCDLTSLFFFCLFAFTNDRLCIREKVGLADDVLSKLVPVDLHCQWSEPTGCIISKLGLAQVKAFESCGPVYSKLHAVPVSQGIAFVIVQKLKGK